MDIQTIQQHLQAENIDAWMLYDFRGSNSLAWKICGLSANAHCTRRWAVIVPKQGAPCKIVSAIEAHTLQHLEMTEVKVSNASEWQTAVQSALAGASTVAMEYSPMAALPVVSKVDAGTVEWIRSMGHTVVSSADIAQHFQAVWSEQQIRDNAATALTVRAAMSDAMSFLAEKIRRRVHVTEFDVQQNIVRFFQENDLITDHEPIVAIGRRAANPHYSPRPENNAAIGDDELVLIDMWAKHSRVGSTYNDITWMCYTGREASPRMHEIFHCVRDARLAGLHLVKERFGSNTAIYGYEVDDVTRAVINARGFGSYFIHRTGHNISEETHGAGANMDNYETHDTRRILPGTSFSIEPGVYIADEIGVRSEISVVIHHDGTVDVPGGSMQDEIVCLQ